MAQHSAVIFTGTYGYANLIYFDYGLTTTATLKMSLVSTSDNYRTTMTAYKITDSSGTVIADVKNLQVETGNNSSLDYDTGLTLDDGTYSLVIVADSAQFASSVTTERTLTITVAKVNSFGLVADSGELGRGLHNVSITSVDPSSLATESVLVSGCTLATSDLSVAEWSLPSDQTTIALNTTTLPFIGKKTGTATLTLTVPGGATASVEVTINSDQTLTITSDDTELSIGDTATVSYTYEPGTSSLTVSSISYYSTDDSIVSVSGTTITSLKAGAVFIYAYATLSDNSILSSNQLYVSSLAGVVKTLTATATETEIEPGDSVTIQVAVTGDGTYPLKQITKAFTSGGDAPLTISASASLDVIPEAVTDLSIKAVENATSSSTLGTFATSLGTLAENTTSSTPYVRPYTYTPTDTGTSTITFTNSTGTVVSNPITITVTQTKITAMTLTSPRQTIRVGSWVRMGLSITPLNARSYKLSFISSDPTVATFNGGMLHALKAGSTTIKVTDLISGVSSNDLLITITSGIADNPARILLMQGVPLDPSYSNPIYFGQINGYQCSYASKNQLDKYTFFHSYNSNYVQEGSPITDDYVTLNLPYGDGVNIKGVALKMKNWDSTGKAINPNYAHVRYESSDNPYKVEDLYFFVTNWKALNADYFTCDLTLDVFTTYESFNFEKPVFIERKHAFRWTVNNVNHILLGNQNCAMGDDLDRAFTPSIVTSTQELSQNLPYVSESDTRNLALTGTQWLWIFAVKRSNGDSSESGWSTMVAGRKGTYPMPVYTICAPIKNARGDNWSIRYYDTQGTVHYDNWDAASLYNYYRKYLPDAVITMRVTPFSPFSANNIGRVVSYAYYNYGTGQPYYNSYVNINDSAPTGEYNSIAQFLGWYVTNDGSLWYDSKATVETWRFSSGTYTKYNAPAGSLSFNVVVPMWSQIRYNEVHSAANDISFKIDYGLPIATRTSLSSQYSAQQVWEPKLYEYPYRSNVIKINDGSECRVDPFLTRDAYLNKAMYVTEATCSPEGSGETIYCTTGLHTNDVKNGEGYYHEDNSVMSFTQSAYTTYINQHSSTMNTDLTLGTINGALNTISGGITGAIAGSKGGVAGAIAGGIMGTIGGAVSIASTWANHNAQMDDLRHTPDSYHSGNNAYARLSNDVPAYLSYVRREITDAEKKKAFEYFYKYGYNWDRYETLMGSQDSVFTRSLFNYVKTNDDQLTNKLSLEIPLSARETIANILNRGTTIWTLCFENQTQKADWKSYYLSNYYENDEFIFLGGHIQ